MLTNIMLASLLLRHHGADQFTCLNIQIADAQNLNFRP